MTEIQIILITILGAFLIGTLLVLVLKVASRQSNVPQGQEIPNALEKMEKTFRDEIIRFREELNKSFRENREETASVMKQFQDMITKTVYAAGSTQKETLDLFQKQLQGLTKINQEEFNKNREAIERSLKSLQEDNTKKLEEMRVTVDEKLHSTLEKRLTESFQLVSTRLEEVHKGLGEMQNLAQGVGDLKNVLSNVKTRGSWGEIQLENLLSQMLTPSQFEKNCHVTRTRETVEFAIKLPGKGNDFEKPVYLPIDSKFPIESYQRLLDASSRGSVEEIQAYTKEIEKSMKDEAKKIKEKYIEPPYTTDFAIMYLPIEGLYAEVLKNPGLVEMIQREYRITIAGPNTLYAILNSLQMGFRTLVIEKKSQEVWNVLSAVKTQFGRFSEILEKVHKKISDAESEIGNAAKKTKTIQSKLRSVEQMTYEKSLEVLPEDEET